LHRALVHANPRLRCGDLSNADAKRARIHKSPGFTVENERKINLANSRAPAVWRNLSTGEKFQQAS